MAGRKMSTAPVMLPEEITANDYIWFLDVSDTSEGTAGTWKLLPADSFESVLSERQTVVRTIHYSNMNFNLPELPMIADAINNSGPYTVQANQRIIFKTSFYEISAVAGVGADRGVSVRSRYYRVHTNQKDFGIGYPAVKVGDISPAGESVSQPVVIDLGDIGSGNVWTAFNLGNPDDAFNPWVVNGETYVMAISNSDEVVWRFVGGDGIWGGSSGKMATSDDFLLQMKTTSELDDATVIHNLNLSAVDPTLPELKQIVSAVISQGPFYALPGQQMIFRVTEGNLNDGFIYEKYYRLLKNITSIGGTNIIQRNITDGWFMPDGSLKYEMPLPESGDASILDLGDIGSDNVWDVFNLGDENEDPWDMREFKFVKTIENSESKYYVFLGSDRFYGGENKPATATDFSEVQETASRFFASQPVFVEYDTIADLLTENAKSPDMVILVKDAVDDARIDFSGIAPSRRMAYYRFFGNDPEDISSYLLISAPYASNGGGTGASQEDQLLLTQKYETIGTEVGDTQKDYNEKNQAIIQALIGNVPHPDYLPPTVSMTTPAALQKVGASYNVNLTLTYNQRDGGPITSQKIEKNGTQVSATNTFSETLVVPIGITTYKGTVNYAQGPVKNNSIGIPDPVGRIPSGSKSTTKTIEGVYPLFATTSNITIATEQPLVSMENANNVVLNLVGESGGNKQFFDIPQDWLDARPLTKIEFYDFNTNAWNSQNQLSTFTAVANTHVVNGNTIDYKRYTNNGSNRGAIRMRLIF